MSPLRPVTDLSARRTARDRGLQRAAHAPVRHVTQAFLDALNSRGDWAPDADEPVGRPGLRAV